MYSIKILVTKNNDILCDKSLPLRELDTILDVDMASIYAEAQQTEIEDIEDTDNIDSDVYDSEESFQ